MRKTHTTSIKIAKRRMQYVNEHMYSWKLIFMTEILNMSYEVQGTRLICDAKFQSRIKKMIKQKFGLSLMKR